MFPTSDEDSLAPDRGWRQRSKRDHPVSDLGRGFISAGHAPGDLEWIDGVCVSDLGRGFISAGQAGKSTKYDSVVEFPTSDEDSLAPDARQVHRLQTIPNVVSDLGRGFISAGRGGASCGLTFRGSVSDLGRGFISAGQESVQQQTVQNDVGFRPLTRIH